MVVSHAIRPGEAKDGFRPHLLLVVCTPVEMLPHKQFWHAEHTVGLHKLHEVTLNTIFQITRGLKATMTAVTEAYSAASPECGAFLNATYVAFVLQRYIQVQYA